MLFVGVSGLILQLLLPTLAVKLSLCFGKTYGAESLIKSILVKLLILSKQD